MWTIECRRGRPEAVERAVGLLQSIADDEVDGVGDLTGFGSSRVQEAAVDVRGLLDAGAQALAEGMADATRRIGSAGAQWRAQDARLGGRA